ncbi:ABC transporter ATP-binding protein [Lachnospiraceae bacterium 45-W7]
MDCETNILKITDLHKSYPLRKGLSLPVLQGIDIKIKAGEMTAVMGASGCGKTTLINVISGVDRADSGSIIIEDTEITNMNKSQMAIFRRNHIGLIFQDFNLLESLNVKDNILLPLILGKNFSHGEELLQKLAAILSIEGITDKYITDISGGEKQRAAIARALINSPQIILADEPTGSLDAKSAKDVMEYLTTINQELQATLLMVTHDTFAASFCHKVILLKEGKIASVLEKGDKSRSIFLEHIYEFLKQIGGE